LAVAQMLPCRWFFLNLVSMPSISTLVGAFLGAASLAASAALPVAQPFENFKAKRQSSNATSNSDLEVDLGYEVYEGYKNQTTGINIWRGYVKTTLHIRSMLTTHIKYSIRCTSHWQPTFPSTSGSGREPQSSHSGQCIRTPMPSELARSRR
jgi:hypothetical protein